MIVGDSGCFSIESEITQAYQRLSLRGLGFFAIYISNQRYGTRAPDSTMLACSFDAVEHRIRERGQHLAPFTTAVEAGKIADAFRQAIYADEHEGETLLGLPRSELADLIYSNHLMWAPDGDEAFDDRSFVLQFDVKDSVRLIGFKSGEGYTNDPGTLTDRWLPANDFYGILQKWHDEFESEWIAMPKLPDDELDRS
jgi:hypothetical protein